MSEPIQSFGTIKTTTPEDFKKDFKKGTGTADGASPLFEVETAFNFFYLMSKHSDCARASLTCSRLMRRLRWRAASGTIVLRFLDAKWRISFPQGGQI